MKNYVITVNGNAYDVTVEEAGGDVSAPAAAAPKAAAPKKAAPAPKAAAGGTPINAPMRGTIVDVKVKVGDKVENDIVSDKDGVVAAICVNKGESVETGAPVVTLN